MASDGGADAGETAPSPPPRDVVAGRYRITGRLGRGGMGTVWQATDELLRRQVAVKELHLTDEGLTARQAALRRERALREARTAALIRHPHVVVVHDVVEDKGHPWIVMELIDGRSLADLLERDGPLAPREAARVGAALADALRAAHEQDIQHRDVKPANVLVERSTGRVVLTDFGIARTPGSPTISETGAFLGSPEYTAPERMSGRGAGPAADLWSLGALLCAAVHGESPFRRDSIGAIVHAVAIDAFTPPPEVGPLLPVVVGLLDRDPARRMGADEARRLLGAFAETGRVPRARAVPEAEAVPGAEAAAGGDPASAACPAAGVSGAAEGAAGSPAGGWAEAAGLPGAAVRPAPRAPDSRRRSGLQVVAVGALVVLAVSAGGAATYLVGRQDPAGRPVDGPPPASAAGFPSAGGGFPPPAPGSGPQGPPPQDGQGPPPDAPGMPRFPPGFLLVTDPAGFAVVLPPAFGRDPEPPYTYYRSPDRSVRFGERGGLPDPRGPLAVLRERHLAGAATYPGYRDAVVTAAQEHGLPAALWQFTYGRGQARRAFVLCWTENGRMYEISLSAPESGAERAANTFDIARGTFAAG
ncbi:protein kinase domain-containing protein [Actinacidiphila sp. ITFR-21]|uniref:protein kinase domain-containing protein n=1 Tax=Actinacidiphila sp. ITFR-21 TaxID=3075199 RepID=UPI00288A6A92|nr:protein kinase [Streptomyces sp. ITFR-21]WNI14342.1 protein kinase [Streptomyces sp. ITFR-21]